MTPRVYCHPFRVYCHPFKESWPDDPEIVDRVPVLFGHGR